MVHGNEEKRGSAAFGWNGAKRACVVGAWFLGGVLAAPFVALSLPFVFATVAAAEYCGSESVEKFWRK